MGRPLHKRNFGPPTPDGKEIKTNFHNGSATVEGFIVKQLGSKKFRVAQTGVQHLNAEGELVTFDCFLTDKVNITAGQMTVTVRGDDNEVYLASKISAHKVYVTSPNILGSNVLDNTSIQWTFTNVAGDDAVQIEEAGDDNIDATRIRDGNPDMDGNQPIPAMSREDDDDFAEIDPDA